jgi:putative hemolysin
MAQFEEDAASAGLTAAARNLLSGLVENVCVFGAEHIPAEGPLLLACNHPGAYDGLALLTGLCREDIRVVASGVDFTHSLPVMEQRLIYVTPNTGVRMKAVRESLRHLHAGRSVLIFPSGRDPAGTWLAQALIFTELVPKPGAASAPRLKRAGIVTASHVLSACTARLPLVREEWQRRGWRSTPAHAADGIASV